MVNYVQAKKWVENGELLIVKDNAFIKCGIKEKLMKFFYKNTYSDSLQKIFAFLQNQMPTVQGEERLQYLTLGTTLINKYSAIKASQVFDRLLVQQNPERAFVHQKNQFALLKWKRNGLPEDIFIKHPDFCHFMESSGLLSQMKVTRDTIIELDGVPALKVKGEWTKWTEVNAQYKPIYSPTYDETFFFHTKDYEVYTYLDNGKGLQPHHPFLNDSNCISKLDEQEYGKVLNKAHEFVRENEKDLTAEERAARNAKRPFILQIVTSYVKGPDTHFHKFIVRPKHPWTRLIIGVDAPELKMKRGEVYEDNFGWKSKVNGLIATQGQSRRPDIWNYKSTEEKVVTNIALSEEEALAWQQFTKKYHRSGVYLGNPVGFHLLRQNCSTFVHVGLEVVGIDVPTEMSLSEALYKASPQWILEIFKAFAKVKKVSNHGIRAIIKKLPDSFKHPIVKVARAVNSAVHAFFSAIAATFIGFINLCLGDAQGKGGIAFVPLDSEPRNITPEGWHWKKWLKLSSYRFHIPGVLQRWQREQASTVVYKNSVKLAIVP